MSENGLFKKTMHGFEPEQVLDYIEQMQYDFCTKEKEMTAAIQHLEQENQKLLTQVQQQAECNEKLKEQLQQCEQEFDKLCYMTDGYADESHHAVSTTREPTVREKATEYKITTKSRFDIIRERLSALGDLIGETKKYLFE